MNDVKENGTMWTFQDGFIQLGFSLLLPQYLCVRHFGDKYDVCLL